MKNRFRIITSLILVTLLVTALAAPAIAAPEAISDTDSSYEGAGTWNGYNYKVFITYTEDSGRAHIALTNAATYVTAISTSHVYNSTYRIEGYTAGSNTTGYMTATAFSGNTFVYGEETYTGVVDKTIGVFYIGNACVIHGIEVV